MNMCILYSSCDRLGSKLIGNAEVELLKRQGLYYKLPVQIRVYEIFEDYVFYLKNHPH